MVVSKTHVKVALVFPNDGFDSAIAQRMYVRFRTRGDDDVGRVDVLEFNNAGECREAIEDGRVTALCIWFRTLSATALVSYINDIRTTCDLVPICLVGTRRELEEMPGVRQSWKERFGHYYRLITDKPRESLDEDIGIVRDVFIADAIKALALGRYETTPGRLLEVRHPVPRGVWIAAGATIAAAIIGAILKMLKC